MYSDELPVYIIDGWQDDGSGDVSTAHLLARQSNDPSITNIGLMHRNGEQAAMVTSHRAGRWSFAAARNFAADYASHLSPPPRPAPKRNTARPGRSWHAQAIDVEGTPVYFEVSNVGDLHAAAGQGPNCIITISSSKVPLEGISLVVPKPPPGQGPIRTRAQ